MNSLQNYEPEHTHLVISETEAVDVADLIENKDIKSSFKCDRENIRTQMKTIPKSNYDCLIETNIGCITGNFVYSETETLFIVFQYIDKFSRRWYEANKEYATNHFYLYISDNGEVRYFAKEGKHNNFTGGIADI